MKVKNFIPTLLCGLFIILSCAEKEEVINEGYLQINGSEVYFKIIGEGEPLIIVHGGPVMDHSYFLPHLEALANDYQLVFYDQRAAGRSSVAIDSASMNLDGFVDDIELLRKELGLEKINLLGHSWGGLIAMKYAIKYDENLNHLILSNSMAPSTQDWQTESFEVSKKTDPADQNRLNNISSSGLLRTEDPSEAIKEMMMISYKVQMFDQDNLTKLQLYTPKDFMYRSQVYSLLGPDMMAFDLYKDLSSVKTKTLVIYGASEPAVSLHAEKMQNSFPNAELVVMQGSGHFPFIEVNEAYLDQIRAFIGQ